MNEKTSQSSHSASSVNPASDNPGDQNDDALTVYDGAGRRSFIRKGAAFVATAGIIGTSGKAYADDCDRAAGSQKNAQAANTDSDSGASADPEGCGREPEAPKISRGPSAPVWGVRDGVGKVEV